MLKRLLWLIRHPNSLRTPEWWLDAYTPRLLHELVWVLFGSAACWRLNALWLVLTAKERVFSHLFHAITHIYCLEQAKRGDYVLTMSTASNGKLCRWNSRIKPAATSPW